MILGSFRIHNPFQRTSTRVIVILVEMVVVEIVGEVVAVVTQIV
jgi:hypothetical protein